METELDFDTGPFKKQDLQVIMQWVTLVNGILLGSKFPEQFSVIHLPKNQSNYICKYEVTESRWLD